MTSESNNGHAGTLEFDEGQCERYLFGEMSEAEQEEFETAYFNDDAFFERFAAVKSELLDLYARDELDKQKRARMEPHFLATAPRRKRIAESDGFIRAITAISNRDRVMPLTPAPDRVGWFESISRLLTLPRLAGVAALLVVLLGAALLINRLPENGQTTEQVAQPPRVSPETSDSNRGVTLPPPEAPNSNTPSKSEEFATTEPERVPSPAPKKSPGTRLRNGKEPRSGEFVIEKDPDAPKYAVSETPVNEFTLTLSTVGRDDPAPSITLDAGSTRGPSGGNTLALHSDDSDRVATIALRFSSENYASYIVTISDVNGRNLSRKTLHTRVNKNTADGLRRIVIRIDDTTRLTAKDYLVKLEGRRKNGKTETIDEYYFHVKRTPINVPSEPPANKP